jgi:hypothetical protein
MPSKKHRPEEIIGKLREAEVVLAQGATTAEACRRIAVSEQIEGGADRTGGRKPKDRHQDKQPNDDRGSG